MRMTKLMFIFFSNGNGSAFENNLDSGLLLQAPLRDVQRQRCWKRYSGDGQRLWDYGTTSSSMSLHMRVVLDLIVVRGLAAAKLFA